MSRRSFRLALASVAVTVAATSSGRATTPSSEPPRQAPAAMQQNVPTAPAREELTIPTGQQWLGTVRIPMNVLADGEPLPAGTYRVRLTGETATDKVAGQLAELERWVEFVQGSTVRGRAMAPVVPSNAVSQVADSRPPTVGRFRVERLKGDDFLRLWYNHKGDQILIYLTIPPRPSR